MKEEQKVEKSWFHTGKRFCGSVWTGNKKNNNNNKKKIMVTVLLSEQTAYTEK